MPSYLLVHPERFPANDDFVLGPELPDGVALADFERWYTEAVSDRALTCARRVVLLDSYGREDLADDGEFLGGLDPTGWEVAACEPHEVGHVVRRLFLAAEGQIIVSGYARHDCVARAQKALKKLGLEVTLDELTTLPLSAAGASAYLERAPVSAR